MAPPLLSSAQVVRALEAAGFKPVHRKGSHATFRRARDDLASDVVVVPMNKRQIAPGTMRSIIAMAKMTEDEFVALALKRGRR